LADSAAVMTKYWFVILLYQPLLSVNLSVCGFVVLSVRISVYVYVYFVVYVV